MGPMRSTCISKRDIPSSLKAGRSGREKTSTHVAAKDIAAINIVAANMNGIEIVRMVPVDVVSCALNRSASQEVFFRIYRRRCGTGDSLWRSVRAQFPMRFNRIFAVRPTPCEEMEPATSMVFSVAKRAGSFL